MSPIWIETVESSLLIYALLRKKDFHEVSTYWLSAKALQNMQDFKLFSFSRKMQYGIIKPNTGSNPFSNRKYNGREKTSKEKKSERKKYRIREYKFSWRASNWIIRKDNARCKFLRKLAPKMRKLIFPFINLFDLHVCYSELSFERNSETLIHKKVKDSCFNPLPLVLDV